MLFFHSCFSGVKKNLDNLKKCKFDLVNLLVHTEPNPDSFFIPKFIITPIVSVNNPNPEDVEIYRFNLQLFLLTKNGQQLIGNIINQESKLIPKFTSIEIPLSLDMDQKKGIDAKLISLLLQLVSAASRGDEAEIFITGNVELHSEYGNLSLPVSETQKIKLKQ